MFFLYNLGPIQCYLVRGVYIGLRQDLDPLTRKLSKRRLCCTVKGLAYAFNPSLPFSSTSFCLIMEGPYSEVAKDQEEGNVADHKTKAADNRPESADHNTKAADHNTPEHNDCLPADGCLTASRFPESVCEFRRRREKTRQVC